MVTGHTGFTGGWTCTWLEGIGARLSGFSLAPETKPSLFEVLDLERRVPTVFGDICDFDALSQAVSDAEPELILHLAAQPLVRRSYREPVRTFATNTLGTAHVLEAARSVKTVKAVVCVTTDKVYKNYDWPWPYRENDPLGGKDPYSASKSAAEMVIQSYAASFGAGQGRGPLIATARGGNIIGGGDWSEDRLVPDFVRAVVNGTNLTLRYPDATRPWQHVLALVQGYLMLLAGLLSADRLKFAKAWNFGPHDTRQFSVREMLELIIRHWKRPSVEYMDDPLPEANSLALDSSLARNQLAWQPVWDPERVISETAKWYRDFYLDPSSARVITRNQVEAWRSALQR